MSGQDRGHLALSREGQTVDSYTFKVLRFLRICLKDLRISLRPFTISNLDLKVSCPVATILRKARRVKTAWEKEG